MIGMIYELSILLVGIVIGLALGLLATGPPLIKADPSPLPEGRSELFDGDDDDSDSPELF